jgi:MraZ protein
MSGFLGSFTHQVDEKGRLSLPVSFRRAAAEGPLVVVQAHRNALSLYPAETWKDVEARLLELRRTNAAAREYVLRITSRAIEVLPDKQGRILLPAKLLQSIGVTDSALVVGAIDQIELWNPERFEDTTSDQATEAERFGSQVFA